MKAKRFATFGLLALVAVTSGALLAQAPQAVGTWASVGDVGSPLSNGAVVALPDGRSLIAGGIAPGDTPTDAVTIYNPVDNSVTAAGVLVSARSGHTATLLKDGRVLVVGGVTDGGLISTDIELFDPASGTSALVAFLAEPRRGHIAASLPDGTVLIAGGTTTEGVVLQSAAIFDPDTSTVSPLSTAMQIARVNASATPLLDGRVLVAGGSSGAADLASAEIYDRYSRSFAMAATQMSVARQGHSAVLLPNNGGVLIVGGTSNGIAQAGADLFLPAVFPDPFSYGEGEFASTGAMTAARSAAIAGPTSIDGYAFAAGGGAPDAEVYRFATIKTDKDDYAPGERAVITGSGWQAGEQVRLLFQEDPAVHDDYSLTVTANSSGDVYWNQWAPEAHDLSVRFYLMATGAQSRAQTTFTDGNVNVRTVGAATAATVNWVRYITPACTGVPAASGSIAAATNGNGTGIPSGAAEGSSLRLTAEPLTGYSFSNWSGDISTAAPDSSNPICVEGRTPTRQIQVNYTSSKATPTITFNPAPTPTFGGGNFTVNAGTTNTDSSALTYSVVSGPCALVSGSTFSSSGAGACVIQASGAATANFNAASNTQSVTITKATSTTTTVGAVPFTYDGTTHSGGSGTVTGAGGLSTSATSLTYSGDQVNAGTYYVTAHYGGDANHAASDGAAVAIVINKASSTTTTVGAVPFTYDGTTHSGGSGTVTGAGGLSTSATSLTYSGDQVNAGTYYVTAHYAGDANHAASDGAAVAIVINKASSTTTTVGAVPFTYDGTTHSGGSGTVTGAGGLSTSATSLTYSGDQVNAGTYYVTAHYAGDANHVGSDGDPVAIEITKAPSTTTTVGAGPFVYTGSAQTGGSGTVTGAGTITGSATVTYTGDQINVGTYYVTAHYAGDANHVGSDGDPVAIEITKAPSTTTTVGAGPFTYDGTTHAGGSGTVTGAGTITGSATVTYTGDQINVGTYYVTAHYAGDANHVGSDGDPVAIEITKAPSTTTTVGAGPFTYDGTTHTGGSGTVTGAGIITGSATVTYTGDQVNAGTYYVTAHYAGDANHVGSDGDPVAIVINKGSSTTITVGDGPFTYDGTTHAGGSGTVTGVGGLSTSATSLTYTGDQVNAGTYYVTAHYAGDANHEPSDGAAVAIEITKAASTTTTVGAGPFVYTGSTQTGGSGTVTGAGSITGSATVTYTGDQINVGTYYVTAHYAGDANHEPSDGDPVAITITKAASTTTTVGAGPFVYDTTTHSGGSGTVTGAGGLTASATSVSYTGDQVHAGTYYVTAHYAGDANHEASDGAAVAIVINKASSTTITLGAGPFVYDTTTHSGGSGTVTGAGGLSTNATSLTYTGDQVNAGTYYVTAHYAGDANHEPSDGAAVAIEITKAASATTTVGAGPFVYDTTTHSGGSGTVNGIGGLSTNATSLTYTGDQVNAGTYYVTAHYAGDANHEPSDGAAVAITINKAIATVTVSGYTGTYDAAAHGATATIVGVTGDLAAAGSSFNPGASFKDVPGGTANWTFTGGTNYTDQHGTAAIVISRKEVTVSGITANNKPFDGNTVATLNFGSATLVGVISPDIVTLNTVGATGAFATPAVGGPKVVTIAGLTLGGAHAGNYSLTQPTAMATITAWSLSGFLQPVGIPNTYPGIPSVTTNTVWNTIKGGQTVPLKFKLYASVGGSELTNATTDVLGFVLAALPCAQGQEDPVDPDFTVTGGTILRYDGTQFIQNWQTPKGANQCYRITMTAHDGSQLTAFFKTK